jgi:hypothetical protein
MSQAIALPLPVVRHAAWTGEGALIAALPGALVLVNPRQPAQAQRICERPELDEIQVLAVPGPGHSVYALLHQREGASGALVRIDRRAPELWDEIAPGVSHVIASPTLERCAFAAPHTNELYLQDGDTGLIRRLGSGVPLAFSPDGEQLLARASARDEAAPFVLYRTAGARRELRPLLAAQGGHTPRGFGFRDGAPCALDATLAGAVDLVDLNTGEREPLGTGVACDSAVMTPNGVVLFWTEEPEGQARLWRLGTQVGDRRELAHAAKPRTLYPSCDGRWLAHSGPDGTVALGPG